MSSRLLRKLLGGREEIPVDAPAAETRNLPHRLADGSARSEHEQTELPEDMEESSADEGAARR
jgi:hypothetical protein